MVMRIAVLSDTRLPTSWEYPGHGLGKANLMIAEGLAARGHEVAVFGGDGSASDQVPVFCRGSEVALASEAYAWGPDVVLDGSHSHVYQPMMGGPVVNLSHDREQHPGKNAVYPSKAHAAYWGAEHGEVVYYGLGAGPAPGAHEGYLLFLGAVDIPHKGAFTAIRVAQRAGVPLLLAGSGRIEHPGFMGPVSGQRKEGVMRRALALIVPGEIESAGLVALEAAALGVPVVARAAGGLVEYVADGVTGYLCQDEVEMSAAVQKAATLDRTRVQQWVQKTRSYSSMILAYEGLLYRAMQGEVW